MKQNNTTLKSACDGNSCPRAYKKENKESAAADYEEEVESKVSWTIYLINTLLLLLLQKLEMLDGVWTTSMDS